ncbi:uncharacterized protein TNCV_1839471 [Trichonephila clavipes]|nr:uncharacterized protein TNCV_1839471 [Trichonephila clavipes]
MLSLRDGNAIETLLMTAQINTDLVNHLVPLTTEPSIILVRVGTDACKSIINSILRYKDYDSHKNAHKDFQKQFINNRSIDTGIKFMIDYGLEMIGERLLLSTKNILQNILPGINLEDTLKHATIADKV